MDNTDELLKKKLNELFGVNSVKYKGKNSICSTCKYFDGNVCAAVCYGIVRVEV